MALPVPGPSLPLRTSVAAVLAVGLLASLGACSGSGEGGVRPQLSSESDCFVSSDPNRCRLAHDKAGGYPITRGGGG